MKNFNRSIKAHTIYNQLPCNKINDILLKEAYGMGLIPKKDLIHNKTYYGYCRNSDTAIWYSDKNCFVYKRNKFGYIFDEEIVHPEDDDGFDIFVPIEIEIND